MIAAHEVRTVVERGQRGAEDVPSPNRGIIREGGHVEHLVLARYLILTWHQILILARRLLLLLNQVLLHLLHMMHYQDLFLQMLHLLALSLLLLFTRPLEGSTASVPAVHQLTEGGVVS